MACDLHRNQFRKGTEIPYISHLLIVCGTVLEYGGNEDMAIAALLHDAVEDQGGVDTLDRIEAQFGRDVARMVRECSDSMATPKPPWEERKTEYLKHLGTAGPDTVLISIADKLHNLRSIVRDHQEVGDNLWSRFNVGPEETCWYYRSLLEEFKAVNAPPDLLSEFRATLLELEGRLSNQGAVS